MDVTSPPQIAAAVQAVRDATGGKLDILVNNTGAFNLMAAADQRIEEAKALYDVNVFGLLAVTQAFLPLLLAVGDGSGGMVANVSSVAAVMSPVFQVAYASSKAAVSSMSHTMRKEFAPLGVR